MALLCPMPVLLRTVDRMNVQNFYYPLYFRALYEVDNNKYLGFPSDYDVE